MALQTTPSSSVRVCHIALLIVLSPAIHAQTFTKETTGAIVEDIAPSFGAVWFDVDKDDDLDLLVANAAGQNNALYRNDLTAGFAKITSGPLVNDGGDSFCASVGDYDNDGYNDVFVGNFNQNNFLYRNLGNGTFGKITTGSIVQDGGNTNGSSWIDFENDGDLDLFAVNVNGQNDFVYLNNGAGVFSRLTTGPLVTDGVSSHGCSWSDFDNDGDLDVFVPTNYQGRNLLYKNNGGGNFVSSTAGVIVEDIGTSIGASWGDSDNDGDMDLFVTNSLNQKNSLYRNNGNEAFERIVAEPFVSDSGNSAGSEWVDVDNDGDLDLFVANSSNQKNFLYENQGGGTFMKVTQGEIVNDTKSSRGVAWADIDNDGDIDLFVSNGFGTDDRNDLYRNNGNANAALQVRCVGTTSNRSAIGARVSAKATINGTAYWQHREIAQQGGAYSGSVSWVHFGLGNATMVDSLKVLWPSGVTQVLTGVAPSRITIVEDKPVDVKGTHTPESGIRLHQNFPNPFNPTTNIRFQIPSAGFVTMKVYDVLGRVVSTLVSGELTAGEHSRQWNAEGLATGVYFYRFNVNNFVETRMMHLVG